MPVRLNRELALQCWGADHGKRARQPEHEEVPHVEPLSSGYQQQGN